MDDVEILSIAITALLGAFPPLVKFGLERLSKSAPQFFDSPVGRTILNIFGVKTAIARSAKDEFMVRLKKAAVEIDRMVDEIGHYAEERQATVAKLENDLQSLSQREKELRQSIEGLEKVPLPAAEYFAKLVEKTEKRSAVRDYSLFLLGVGVSAIVAILLKKLGWG